jgi:hypothetical protein
MSEKSYWHKKNICAKMDFMEPLISASRHHLRPAVFLSHRLARQKEVSLPTQGVPPLVSENNLPANSNNQHSSFYNHQSPMDLFLGRRPKISNNSKLPAGACPKGYSYHSCPSIFGVRTEVRIPPLLINIWRFWYFWNLRYLRGLRHIRNLHRPSTFAPLAFPD